MVCFVHVCILRAYSIAWHVLVLHTYFFKKWIPLSLVTGRGVILEATPGTAWWDHTPMWPLRDRGKSGGGLPS